MSPRPRDGAVIVVGAGHNGLVAAVRLARSGRRVTVLERRQAPGGLAAAAEFHPGYRVPGMLHDTAAFRPRIAAALGLERHGLAWRQRAAVVVGRPGRRPIRLAGDEGVAAWRRSIDDLRPFLLRLQERPPPRMRLRDSGDFVLLGLEGLALRRLGKRRGRELLRVLPMPARDWLLEWLDDEDVAGALAAPGLLGGFTGPRAPGTSGALLIHESCAGREVAGGPAALAGALTAAAAAAGVEVRTGAEVTRIEVERGGVAGVRLAGEDRLAADVVVAACHPTAALLGLLPPGTLGLRDERDLRTYRSRGTVAKLHLALSGGPELAGDGGVPVELLRVGGLDDLERASDAVKYGALPAAPTFEMWLPSLAAPELAPAGHQVASLMIDFVPHAPQGGWTAELRQRLEDAVMERLEAVAPGLRELVVGSELLTPPDLEERYAIPGGHLFHGEVALDQMLTLRPAICAGRYQTPVAGLFLGGGGSHPGGGFSGLPGWLAARAVLGR